MSVENTGRIARTISRTARDILFGATADQAINTDLAFASKVDCAHVLMLSETGILPAATARALVQEIAALRGASFDALRGRVAPRGIFLLYEDHLIERLGMAIGGALQTGRSRNDLNATVARLRMRAPFERLVREALRLQAVLLRAARRYASVVMPAYTHFQPALPVTYGHYLAAIAAALDRDIEGVLCSADQLDESPLGAGAVGGTALPLRTSRTAELLGFLHGPANSIDAVATRDFALRLLGAATLLGVTLSRTAGDFLSWSSAEFDFLRVPDHLVGSSSMMPQKRNVYFLEHVQGRSAAALGAFVQATTAAHAKPFTNTISVSTEAMSCVWDALRKTTEAVTLLRLIVAEATPQPAKMLRRAEDGFTSATELANRLVVSGGLPFRAAHHAVGALVNAALETGQTLQDAASASAETSAVSTESLDASSVARAAEYGGGPGAASIHAHLETLTARWKQNRIALRQKVSRWKSAERYLDEAMTFLIAGAAPQATHLSSKPHQST